MKLLVEFIIDNYLKIFYCNVKWKKQITLNEPGSVSIELPKEATNITVYKITDENSGNENTDEVSNETTEDEILNETEVIEDEQNSPDEANETIEEIQKDKEKNKNKDSEKLDKEKDEDKNSKKEKVKTKITAQVISGKISAEVEIQEDFSISKFFNNFFSFITGRVIEVQETEDVTTVIIDFSNDSYGASTDFEIEYETPAPVAFESPLGDDPAGPSSTANGKKIVISSDVHYENILAFTELSREVGFGTAKLYHIVNNAKKILQIQ